MQHLTTTPPWSLKGNSNRQAGSAAVTSAWLAPILVTVLVSGSGCGNGGSQSLPWPDDSLYSLVIRTDFGDDASWERVRSAIAKRYGDFMANVEFVDDRRFDQLTVAQLLELSKESPDHDIAFLVDGETLASSDHPILIVDLTQQPGRTFRLVPAAMWEVQINLAIANTSWEDHADHVDPQGIYRGLPELQGLDD